MKSALLLEDKFNDENIFFIKHFKPHRVFYLSVHNRINYGYFEFFAEYMSNEFPNVEIQLVYLDKLEFTNLIDIVQNLGKIDFINLASSNSLLSVMISRVAQYKNIPSYYVDIRGNRLVNISEIKDEVSIDLPKISIFEYIDISGGKLVNNTTSINKSYDVRLLINYIVKNQDIWKRMKIILSKSDVFIHNIKDKRKVEVVLENLNKGDFIVFRKFERFMKKIEFIKTEISSKGNLIMNFKTQVQKNMLFITGKWLESFVYMTVKTIMGVKDVQSGVSFNWIEDNDIISNEVDVLATYNSRLYFISCKDSSGYDVDTLNELKVYTRRIGGSHAKAILAVTDEPQRDVILERAEEMDISVLIFDGNYRAFRRKLEEVFMYE